MHCTSRKNTEKSYNAWSSHWSKSIVHKRVHSSRLAEFLSAHLGVTKFISGSNCKSSEWMLVQLNCAIWNCNLIVQFEIVINLAISNYAELEKVIQIY